MQRTIKIKDENGLLSNAEVVIEHLKWPNSKLTITLADSRAFFAIAEDAFQALRLIRLQTESLNIKLLIQGCRPCCWPSGMSAQMSNGMSIYVRLLNREVRPKIVNTFDEAEDSEIGLLSDQDQFNLEWRAFFNNAS